MNRRNFLKILGAVCATAAINPVEFLPPLVSKPHHSGISNKELCELITLTLQDLPKQYFEISWDIDSLKTKNKIV